MSTPSDPNKCMTVKYSLNRWDLIQCRLWVNAHNRFLVIFTVIMSLTVPLLSLHDLEIASRSVGFKILFVGFGTGIMFCFIAVVQFVVMCIFTVMRENRGILGTHELMITDEGLAARSDVNESMHRWSGFHKVTRTRRCLMIFVTDSFVYYVPFRYFSKPEDVWLFRDEILRRWKEA